MRKVVKVTVLVAVLYLIGSTPGAIVQAADKPCEADIAKFCKDIEPGDGRIMKCLEANKAQVSEGCKVHLTAVYAKSKEAGGECRDEIMRYCSTVKPGQGRIMKCLLSHQDDTNNPLGPKCAQKMKELNKEAKTK